MRELFDYLSECERQRIKITIANKVYKIITKEIEKVNFDKKLCNSINRMKIAEEISNDFYKTLNKYYKVERHFEVCELENDLAEFIDFKIPRQYYMSIRKKETGIKDNTILKNEYFGIESKGLEGLEYIYEDNYIRDKESDSYKIKRKTHKTDGDFIIEKLRPITDKQKRYLKRLIKYSHQRLLEKDHSECENLVFEIEVKGIDNIDIESAKRYISKFLEYENNYKIEYEKQAKEINEKDKVIDFTQYINRK